MEARRKPNRLPALDFDKCLLVLRAVLGDRPRVERDFSIGITTTSGRRLVIDSKADPIIAEDRRDDTALSIVLSERTLSALLTGTLDVKNPGKDHLLVWGGDLAQWTALVDAVAAYNSLSVRTLRGGAR